MDLDQFHRDSIIFDGHSDFLYNAVNERRRFEERSDVGHVDLPRLRAGGCRRRSSLCMASTKIARV